MSTADEPTAYWAAFSHHNHVVAAHAEPDRRGKIAALCGVLTPPGNITAPDPRPTCTGCREQARSGHYSIVERPN